MVIGGRGWQLQIRDAFLRGIFEGKRGRTNTARQIGEDALSDMENVSSKRGEGAFDFGQIVIPSIRRGDESETQFLGI